MNLSPSQITALREVSAAQIDYDRAVRWAAAEAAKITAEKIATAEAKRAERVQLAITAGVPKTQIASKGLGKSMPYLYRMLTAAKIDRSQKSPSPTDAVGPIRWEDREARAIRIALPDFDSAMKNQADYPPILAGVVKREGGAWVKITDDGDRELENGQILPGYLESELQPGPSNKLTAILDEWAEANA